MAVRSISRTLVNERSPSRLQWRTLQRAAAGFSPTFSWPLDIVRNKAGQDTGIKNLRIHDPEAIIRNLTGHRSRELERYQHPSPVLKSETVELIAKELSDTATGTVNFEEHEEARK